MNEINLREIAIDHCRNQLDWEDWERELHYQMLDWASVSTWEKIKRWILWQWSRFQLWRTKDEIPF